MPVRLVALVALLGVGLGCGNSRTTGLAAGEPCAPTVAPGETNQQCASGLCVALDSASGFCTVQCSDDSNCPDTFVCQAAGRYGKICRKLTGCKVDDDCPSGHVCNPGSGNCYIKVQRDLCSPCQDDAQCPANGSCFTAIGSNEQFCTGPCGVADACPLGFACQEIPIGLGKVPTKQCVPQKQTCNAGRPLCAPCSGDGECGGPLDLCVRNVVSSETFCGRDCNPAKNVCPAPGCNPLELDSAQNPECPMGFACANIGKSDDPNVAGTFQCVPNSNTCKGYCDATDQAGQTRQCGLGFSCVDNACTPAADGRMCSPCFDNDDCRKGGQAENRCLVNNCPDCPYKGETFCSTTCANDGACVRSFGPGFVCKPVSDPTGGTPRSFCMPQRGSCKTGTLRLGDDCGTRRELDCLSGICLVAGSRSVCSLACAKDSDCGDARFRCCEATATGYNCNPDQRQGDGPVSGAGVCAPFGGLFGDDCTPGRPPCQSGTCLDLGTARVCTVPCGTGGSCPMGFACRPAQVSNVTTGADAGSPSADICFPVGGGKSGANCSFGPAACESGLCIRKESGPICTQGCAGSGDCPPEWSCESVGAVTNQSVQACVPPSLL